MSSFHGANGCATPGNGCAGSKAWQPTFSQLCLQERGSWGKANSDSDESGRQFDETQAAVASVSG